MAGLHHLHEGGYTHALQMDADGQHSTAHIGEMIATSRGRPANIPASAASLASITESARPPTRDTTGIAP